MDEQITTIDSQEQSKTASNSNESEPDQTSQQQLAINTAMLARRRASRVNRDPDGKFITFTLTDAVHDFAQGTDLHGFRHTLHSAGKWNFSGDLRCHLNLTIES